MTTDELQNEAAHDRLAAIRSTLGCAVGEEAIAVRRMSDNAADLSLALEQLTTSVLAEFASIRRDLEGVGIACADGEEVAKVAHLAEQYRLCRERLDQIEREAAEEEAEQIARVKVQS